MRQVGHLQEVYIVFWKIGTRVCTDMKRLSQKTYVSNYAWIDAYDYAQHQQHFAIEWRILGFRRIIPHKLLYHS